MKFENIQSDEAVLAEIGDRLARIRLNMNLPQRDLAAEAGVSLRTVQRLEGGSSTQLTNLIRVLRALDLLGNLGALVPAEAASPIQQLRTGGRERRRASRSPEAGAGDEPWSWGDDS